MGPAYPLHQHSPLPSPLHSAVTVSLQVFTSFFTTLPHMPPLGVPLLQSGFLPTHPPSDSVIALKCKSGHTALFKTLHCDGPCDSATPVPQLGDSSAENQVSKLPGSYLLSPFLSFPHQVLASSPAPPQGGRGGSDRDSIPRLPASPHAVLSDWGVRLHPHAWVTHNPCPLHSPQQIPHLPQHTGIDLTLSPLLVTLLEESCFSERSILIFSMLSVKR